jgi:hypothetical protein
MYVNPELDVPTWQEFITKASNHILVYLYPVYITLARRTSPRLLVPGLIQSLSLPVRPRSLSHTSPKRHVPADAKSFAAIDISYGENFVDLVWGSARPERPKNPVFALDLSYAGKSHADKLGNIRQELEKQKARAFVVTMLDEVAWLFNLRGSDIDYNPVFFAYAVVSPDNVHLFVDLAQVSQDVRAQLGQEKVQLLPYDGFIPYLKELGTGLQVRLYV